MEFKNINKLLDELNEPFIKGLGPFKKDKIKNIIEYRFNEYTLIDYFQLKGILKLKRKYKREIIINRKGIFLL